MKIIKINQKKIKADVIDEIIRYLKAGKVVVLPTDTLYGFSCAATNVKAVNKVRRVKRREKNKPFLVLVSSRHMANRYSYISKNQDEYLKKAWPGPVTVILKSRNILPKTVASEQASVAIRLPKYEFISTIIKKAGTPLISTSLNVSGQQPIELDSLKKKFKTLPDLLVKIGSSRKIKPSKIIDIRDINNIKIIRN